MPVVDGVALHRNVYRIQARNVGESVIAYAKQRELMASEIELPEAVQFVLLAILRTIQEAIAENSPAIQASVCGFAEPHPAITSPSR